MLFRLASFPPAAAALAVLLFAGSACRSSSTNVTAPTSDKCAVALSGTGLTVPGEGGTGSITITTERECAWTAASQAAWIALTPPTSGQGPGSVAFTVGENPATSVRRGMVSVGSRQVEVQQAAAPCRYAVDPVSQSVDAGGGTARYEVRAQAGCTWTAQVSAPWTTIVSGATGSGDGAVVIGVSANTGALRTATVTIAGQSVTLAQGAGTACAFGVTLSTSSLDAGGGTGTATVTTSPGCQWTASSSQPWLAIVAPAGGTGPGTIAFSAGPNPGAARTATLVVAGQSFSVTQESAQSACRFDVSPGSRNVSASGGNGDFDVSTSGGCSWTASSNASWLRITSGASGTGSGRVSFAADPNGATPRSGTLSIAGVTVTVVQAASSCSFTVSPQSIAVPSGGGPSSVTVTADPGCEWSATSQASWLSITGGASGSGSGTVTFSIAPNTGGAREGTLTVAGRTVTISQAGVACSYSLSPTSFAAGAAGGPSSVAVNAPAGCTWTAASNDGWLTITGGASGSGAGTVSFAVAANTGAARTGTLTVAGHSFVVTQAAGTAACDYVLAPPSQPVQAGGGDVSTRVVTGSTCPWTAVSNVPWIAVTAGASGTGDGNVTMRVSALTGPGDREGTVTIAGRPFTVRQQGCLYTVEGPRDTVPVAGGRVTVRIITTATCQWTASSAVNWLQIDLADLTGSGPGDVDVTVSPNTTGAARSGTLTVAGQTITIQQQ